MILASESLYSPANKKFSRHISDLQIVCTIIIILHDLNFDDLALALLA